MTMQTVPDRRAVLKLGALLATPVAAPAVAALGDAQPPLSAHEAAIRALHQQWLRDVNQGRDAAGTRAGAGEVVRAIAADHAGDPDQLVFAADGARASGRYRCQVQIQTEVPPDGTFAQMAHAQGGGVVRRVETRLLTVAYVNTGTSWAIAGIDFASA